jgi:hypothetical protein
LSRTDQIWLGAILGLLAALALQGLWRLPYAVVPVMLTMVVVMLSMRGEGLGVIVQMVLVGIGVLAIWLAYFAAVAIYAYA